MRSLIAVILAAIFVLSSSALDSGDPDLSIGAGDMVLDEGSDGGYHLWIRKKAGVSSVLLTESTVDPEKRLHIFAYRDPEYNRINGDEKRLLNGEFLEKNKGIVDSTADMHPELGEAFHLFIPYVVVYGYPWSRNGEVQIIEGAFLNIKTFAKPYADWSGKTGDNPFTLHIAAQKEQKPVMPEGDFLPATVEEFTEIARDGGGTAMISAGKEDLIPTIGEILADAGGAELDLVLALDTTLSMKDEMPFLKRELVPLVRKFVGRYEPLRVGLLLYRDYFEQYLVKTFPFSDDFDTIQKHIDLVRVHGGKELPEAVYEALYNGLESYAWTAEKKMIILVGDAPPHPKPRGSVTREMVYERAEELGVVIHTIILPQ